MNAQSKWYLRVPVWILAGAVFLAFGIDWINTFPTMKSYSTIGQVGAVTLTVALAVSLVAGMFGGLLSRLAIGCGAVAIGYLVWAILSGTTGYDVTQREWWDANVSTNLHLVKEWPSVLFLAGITMALVTYVIRLTRPGNPGPYRLQVIGGLGIAALILAGAAEFALRLEAVKNGAPETVAAQKLALEKANESNEELRSANEKLVALAKVANEKAATPTTGTPATGTPAPTTDDWKAKHDLLEVEVGVQKKEVARLTALAEAQKTEVASATKKADDATAAANKAVGTHDELKAKFLAQEKELAGAKAVNAPLEARIKAADIKVAKLEELNAAWRDLVEQYKAKTAKGVVVYPAKVLAEAMNQPYVIPPATTVPPATVPVPAVKVDPKTSGRVLLFGNVDVANQWILKKVGADEVKKLQVAQNSTTVDATELLPPALRVDMATIKTKLIGTMEAFGKAHTAGTDWKTTMASLPEGAGVLSDAQCTEILEKELKPLLVKIKSWTEEKAPAAPATVVPPPAVVPLPNGTPGLPTEPQVPAPAKKK